MKANDNINTYVKTYTHTGICGIKWHPLYIENYTFIWNMVWRVCRFNFIELAKSRTFSMTRSAVLVKMWC